MLRITERCARQGETRRSRRRVLTPSRPISRRYQRRTEVLMPSRPFVSFYKSKHRLQAACVRAVRTRGRRKRPRRIRQHARETALTFTIRCARKPHTPPVQISSRDKHTAFRYKRLENHAKPNLWIGSETVCVAVRRKKTTTEKKQQN